MAMKKILMIQGGGRANGNTAQLVSHFAKGAQESGHSVEVISLTEHEVKGCLGCNACRFGKPCVQKDAFNNMVPNIKEADCIVFASPLYFWTVSARIKAFIERFYCVAEQDANPPFGRYEKYPVRHMNLGKIFMRNDRMDFHFVKWKSILSFCNFNFSLTSFSW